MTAGSEIKRPKSRGGRPSSYKPEFCDDAKQLCLLGAKDDELAKFFGVSTATINVWKNEYPEFLESLKEGKDKANAQVAERLFMRAMGYSHEDVHISNYKGEITVTPITKHYAPDTTACIFWLKNRDKERWRDVQQTEISGPNGGPIEINHAPASSLEEELKKRGAWVLPN